MDTFSMAAVRIQTRRVFGNLAALILLSLLMPTCRAPETAYQAVSEPVQSTTAQAVEVVEPKLLTAALEKPAPDLTDPTEQASRGLVWCFEQTGRLATEYDELGQCEALGSIWEQRSLNPTLKFNVNHFDPDQSVSPRATLAGTYDLMVEFTTSEPVARTCQLTVQVVMNETAKSAHIGAAPACQPLQ